MPVQKYVTILRDNIHGITKPAIKRLAYIAGCEKSSGLIYESIKDILQNEMKEILSATIIVTRHSKRNTISLNDLKYALRLRGLKLYGSEDSYELCDTKAKIDKKKGVCVVIPKLAFTRLRREISQDYTYGRPIKVTKEFAENFQYFIERRIIMLLYIACQLAGYRGKKTVTVEDIKFVKNFGCHKEDMTFTHRKTKSKKPKSKSTNKK